MNDDAALLNAWRSGDREAGARLLRRHFATLERFFRHRVEGSAADLIQETLLRCASSRDRFPADVPVRVYVLGIARRTLADHYRKHGRTLADEIDSQAVPVAGVSPSAEVDAKRERRVLLTAIRRLPVEMQLTLELHYWEDLRVHEVAEVLGVSPGTIKSRMSRAKELLRTHIAGLAVDPALARSTLDDFERWARSLHELVDAGE